MKEQNKTNWMSEKRVKIAKQRQEPRAKKDKLNEEFQRYVRRDKKEYYYGTCKNVDVGTSTVNKAFFLKKNSAEVPALNWYTKG